ncbi:helix-turn-helix transcriptional regulator [Paenibacillus sp. NPDC057967]|uniref:helix-turn-helix transcriptional regulator n=1 Tax=Paenibacillus sp. NPDC057967 TaxID=3346293 RepID=UPI0036DC11C0
MKLERLISMVYMLLNNEILSASELADKYNVSQRTIYRDIETICAAGIPVVSYQGVNGGYGIMEEYKMDRSLLGSYDVDSLVTVLQSMSTVFQDERAAETIRRLKTIQNGQQGSSLSLDIGGRTIYRKSLQLLRDSIAELRVVRFQYISLKNERLVRTVEPVQLLYRNDSWYLYGYCRSRLDYREFKLSRMEELKSIGQHFTDRHQPQANRDEWNGYQLQESNVVTVVIHFSATSLARALDRLHLAEKEYHEDGSLTVRFQSDERSLTGWLPHLILGFGEDAEVIEPPALRVHLAQKLHQMLGKYQ